MNQSNSSPISHLTRQCRSCCKQNHWQLCLQSDWSIEMLRKTKSFEVYPQADWSMDILLQRKSIAAVSPSNRDVAGNKTNGSFISYLTGQWKSCCLQNQWKSISNLTGQCRSKINSSSVWLVHGDLLLQNQWRSTSTLTGQWRSCCLQNQWKSISNLTGQWRCCCLQNQWRSTSNLTGQWRCCSRQNQCSSVSTVTGPWRCCC